VIMKIEKDPLPSPQENPALWKDIVAKDKIYWDTLTTNFMSREEFCRNNDAKKSFSKMRAAIAGLYQTRGMVAEAEYAFRQSLRLCPESPEGCFRLADMYMQQHRFDDAAKLMTDYQALDPYNGNVSAFLRQIKDLSTSDARRIELEKKMEKNSDLNTIMELMMLYAHMNMQVQFTSFASQLIHLSEATNMPPQLCLQVAQLCNEAHRPDLMSEALKTYLKRDPRNSRVWIELAAAQMGINQLAEAFGSVKQAISIGGEPARSLVRADERFIPLYQLQQFQALVQPTMPQGNFDLNNVLQ